MANSKIREAIRKAYVSKANRNGPADLVRADQEAGPRIREAETDEDREWAEQDYRDMIDERYDERMKKRDRNTMPKRSRADFSGRRRGS